jgi:putative protein-disulfide isomerase
MARLIYIADPMCSWCYGFGPELSGLLDALPGTAVEIVVGGLRAYNTQVMDQALKTTLLSHWRHVEQASGLPFSESGLARAGFIYDTEPACRAVVAARMLRLELSPSAPLNAFHAIQRAFYAQGLDVTRGDVLAEMASTAVAESGGQIDAAAFRAVWAAEETKAATRNDFAQAQRWGVSGFPTLILEREQALNLVTSGYTSTAVMLERIRPMLQ